VDPLQEKLAKLFQTRFGRRAKIELESDADGISGKIISTKFRGVDMRDRVDMVYDTFDGLLNPEEKQRIVIIGPFTPEEARED
jgi:hypothetical protein